MVLEVYKRKNYNPPLSSTFPHYKIKHFSTKVKNKIPKIRYFLKRVEKGVMKRNLGSEVEN